MTKFRDDELLKKFGKSLRDTRKSKGMSQEQLSFKSDISVNQIGRIERGEINTTISTAYLLSEVLEIDLKELFSF